MNSWTITVQCAECENKATLKRDTDWWREINDGLAMAVWAENPDWYEGESTLLCPDCAERLGIEGENG